MTGDREQRDGPRAGVELRVEYAHLNAFFAEYTRNISRGGTFIRTGQPLPVGAELAFALAIPTVAEPVRLTGVVTRVVNGGQAGPDGAPAEPGMGVRFTFRDDEERRRVERLVEGLMKDSLGEVAYLRLLEAASSRDEPQP